MSLKIKIQVMWYDKQDHGVQPTCVKKKKTLEIIKDSPKTYHSDEFIINAEKCVCTFTSI